MHKLVSVLLGASCLAAAATAASAQAYGVLPPASAMPIMGMPGLAPLAYNPSDWKYEFGLGYFLSTGKTRYTLKDPAGGQNVSRLTYSGSVAHSGEIDGRVDHASGFFLKGTLGLSAAVGNGKLVDEDYSTPSSSTNSSQHGGQIGYGNVDLGYKFANHKNWSLGGFVGYQYFAETDKTFGCTQTGGGSDCPPGTVPANTPIIGDSEHWNALRVGLSGQYYFIPALRLSGEIAYLPYVSLSASDYHAQRQGVQYDQAGNQVGTYAGSTPVSAFGMGVEAEAKLDYAVKDWWTVGLGARFLNLDASGVFRADASGLPAQTYAAQAISYTTTRYGVFANTAVKF